MEDNQACLFRHAPLKANEIRLCRVLETLTKYGQIQLELQHFPFKRTEGSNTTLHSDLPQYTGLSYAWGDDPPSHMIVIDEGCFQIRSNLHLFLQSTHELHEHDTWFWIDQICIDQENVSERNEVVREMERIYSNACSTRIWLGEGNGTTKAAFEVFTEFEGFFEGGDRKTRNKRFKRLVDVGRDVTWLLDVSEMRARSYWSRLWTIQEVWLATHFCMQCGTQKFQAKHKTRTRPKRRDRLGTIGGCRHCSHLASIVDFTFDEWHRKMAPAGMPKNQTFAMGMLEIYNGDDPSLYNVLDLFNGQCLDPRDQVYAVQSLVAPSERIEVDYTLTTIEVFSAVCMRMIPPTPLGFLGDPESSSHKELMKDWLNLTVRLAEAMGIWKDVAMPSIRSGLRSFYDRHELEWSSECFEAVLN